MGSGRIVARLDNRAWVCGGGPMSGDPTEKKEVQREEEAQTTGQLRTVVWFSAGAASAIAAKIVLAENPTNVVLAYTDTGSEHLDNRRFIRDCEDWFGAPVVRLRSAKYVDTWQVWTERRYLVGPSGALCTAELKKKPRFAFERPDDTQVFGYTAEEQRRADRFREQNPDVTLRTPLIERGLTKGDCLALIDRAGIELPAMYRLGYRNNNCIGCVKGGRGYWSKIARDFPAVYARMGDLERHLGHTIFRTADGRPDWLDEMDTTRWHASDDPDFECSLLCHATEQALGVAR